ncbi:MAG TPA: hypothetical protein VF571_12775 [Pyrinomonadaceae bacterium]|jgi:Skp family chaperone for outer membrane proteins
MSYKILFLVLVFCFSKCPLEQDNQNVNGSNTPRSLDKKLTIFLVDRSASFHKQRKEASGKIRNYFVEVCEKIKKYAQEKADRSHEHIIVREISSSSFTDATLVSEIDFAKEEYVFKEPKPTGAYAGKEVDAWQKKKNDFNKDILKKQQDEIHEFEKKIDSFKSVSASDKTDLINAFKALPLYLEKYSDFSKQIIVYSDFKDDQIGKWKIENTLESLLKLENEGGIDLGKDVQVNGEYISMDDLTPEQYQKLKEAWKKVLKCKAIEMSSPPS